MSKFFDVIIVGGGIAGASLAMEIAARRRTLVVEAEEHCAMHATGRSAAFWLAHYGGPEIMPLTLASRALLEQGLFLRTRGSVTIAREYMDLREALSANSREAPLQELKRGQLEALVPGLREGWDFAVFDPSCADIDVAALHQHCLAEFRRQGGTLAQSMPLRSARRSGDQWTVDAGSETFSGSMIVNAAGAWADDVAKRSGVAGLGLQPYRRTIAQLRVGQTGLKDLPLINDALERFYFKGESDNRVWVSPHDETPSDPCDAAAHELDIAIGVDQFESVVDWPVERVERSWAGLRTFAPDRLPVYGFDPDAPGFFWCAGQGGFGIQTSPAAAKLAAALLLGDPVDPAVAHIDPTTFSPARFGRR